MKKIVFILFTIILTQTVYATPNIHMLSDAQVFDYVAVDELEESKPIFYITTANLNLRPTPSTEGTRLALVPAGERVEIFDFRDGEWFEVIYNGTKGFMNSEFLREIIIPKPFTGDIGNVELLEWREAKYVMTIGTIATIIDVRTGLSWEIASASNGNHADVEPITAEDTEIMLEAFGGRWSWTPRPVIILINGRTLAASINGMPHAGSTIRDNNMNGHICLHFKGSTTHIDNAESHVRDHQNAVIEAFNTAQSWSSSPNAMFI